MPIFFAVDFPTIIHYRINYEKNLTTVLQRIVKNEK